MTSRQARCRCDFPEQLGNILYKGPVPSSVEGYIYTLSDELAADILASHVRVKSTKIPISIERKEFSDKTRDFLLEMGKGFSFVARQFRITLNNKHYHIDLVFYHHVLKCFVLIDLKLETITHHDIGQMNMYLNYFKKEEMHEGDNEPIGIVLGAEKDHVLVEYALGGISNKLFASRYRLSLPDKKMLQEAVEQIVYKNKRLLKGGSRS